ncbi:MAG: pullulanase-type alpha-1,6-glucosidase [Chloroflexales bacterium]|nr:pullulanase-type alpha-1,6-glucosidase [Chloroflexales bacterium]
MLEPTVAALDANLARARAHWVSADTILWDVPAAPEYAYELVYSVGHALELEADGIAGGTALSLTLALDVAAATREQFSYLATYTALRLSQDDLPQVPAILRGPMAVQARDGQGYLLAATALQIPGVLDDLFTYDGPLGVSWAGDTPTISVWAPTARAVSLHRFADSAPATQAEIQPMGRDDAVGVWSITGEPGWRGQYYLFEVEVYAPAAGVVHNLVTDPYSLSLSTNSARSQIVDLADPDLAPAGWGQLAKPPIEAPEDIVLYELHVRDFSSFDQSVPEALRGTFMAFTLAESAGVAHLRELAEAGVTHIHLLPAFDFATVDEERARRAPLPLDQLATLAPDSPEQQALVKSMGGDSFNWGYDPLHYTVPEGSYSTDPDGPTRIVEFRHMVQALSGLGLRVVLDVVYNHTHASGQSPASVLDRIVPGYYHRLDADGAVTNSTCCANTATEHAMMERLMLDSVLTWARAYKVDGFRFDLMGHHMARNMLKLRAALDGLTLERDGVDGPRIWVYGEGWDFGEVAGNARGTNATQRNMAGSGIGTFSDRLRDAARGGAPFDDPRLQGFITGLYTDPSELDQGDAATQRHRLLRETDWLKLGLAGNLASYRLLSHEGYELRGDQIDYHGAPAGYTHDPQEQIVYVSAHDNETLFDAVQLKAPRGADVTERARMAMLGLSLTALSQGVPFFHAGDELLRSKSLDRNSYSSSDWFNRIDWSGHEHTFGSGLPPAGDNQAHWPIMRPLLADPSLRPTPALMALTYAHARDMLRIRKSTPLFRLRDADQVRRMVRFFNGGPDQVPGLIVMSISDNGPARLDPQIGQVVVLFNSAGRPVEWAEPALAGASELSLHPVQAASLDERVRREASFSDSAGLFVIPARAAVVFIGPAPLFAAPTEMD